MGWFQHGSTIIVFAPAGFALCDGIGTGTTLRAGQALMRQVLPRTGEHACSASEASGASPP